MTSARHFLAIGAVLGAIGVGMGAFGAHALRGRLPAPMLSLWQTAVQYHLWHALALLAVGLATLHYDRSPSLSAAGWLLAAGVLLFSGSLYALALGAPRATGVVTPFGGLALIAGWLLFAIGVISARPPA